MNRLRKQEVWRRSCVHPHGPGLSAPLTSQPHCNRDTEQAAPGDFITESSCSQKPSSFSSLTACSSSSASDFIWLLETVDYVTTRFQAPAFFKGLSEVQVLPEKTQQLGSCICSYLAAQTPQGGHSGHEYIQDIRVNKNISSPEPNVNQSLLKSTEIKYTPVLPELTQACRVLDPNQHLSRTQDACSSHTALFWEKPLLWPVDKNMPFFPYITFVSWRKTTQIKVPELRHYQVIWKMSLLLTSYSLFSCHHSR